MRCAFALWVRDGTVMASRLHCAHFRDPVRSLEAQSRIT